MTTPDPAAPAPDPAPAPRAGRRFRLRTVLILLVVVPLFLFAMYTWSALNWNYSSGNRSGLLQKFSQKGWLCKTYEGELWQSAGGNLAPIIWNFSVRDAAVAAALDTLVGKEVRLHYTEHRGVPTTCFADTPYFVDGVTAVTR